MTMDMDARKELEELRESTRVALMKSWAEVETLQAEKDGLEEQLFEMEVELNQSLEREADWKRLYEELKKESESTVNSNQAGLGAFLNKGKRGNGTEPLPLVSVASIDLSLGNLLNKRGRNRAYSGDWTSSDDEMEDPTIFSESFANNPNKQRWGLRAKKHREIQDKLQQQINDFEKEKQELMVEWQIKLESRESAINSMEHTTQLQGQTLEELRNELKEAHRELKELDEDASEEIERLNRKLDDKRKLVLKQQDRMRDYKVHIKALTDQLENLCRQSGSTRTRSSDERSRENSRSRDHDQDGTRSRSNSAMRNTTSKREGATTASKSRSKHGNRSERNRSRTRRASGEHRSVDGKPERNVSRDRSTSNAQ